MNRRFISRPACSRPPEFRRLINCYPQPVPISGRVPKTGLAQFLNLPVPKTAVASPENGILLVPKTVLNRYI
ncbi:hypothetical protein FQZ97_427430 [compost metagenome]